MSEDVARALGAGELQSESIGGMACSPRPLTLKELAEVERECVAWYRRRYLEAFRQGVDLLVHGDEAMIAKVEETSRWEASDLPAKHAHVSSRVVVTDALLAVLQERLPIVGEMTDDRARRLVAAALDHGVLFGDEYLELVGQPAPRIKVPYDRWWISGHWDGMVTFVYACFKRDGVTREAIEAEFSGDMARLLGLVKRIEGLTSLQLGNAKGPAA